MEVKETDPDFEEEQALSGAEGQDQSDAGSEEDPSDADLEMALVDSNLGSDLVGRKN